MRRLCRHQTGPEWIAQFQLPVEQDLRPVDARILELDIHEDLDTGRGGGVVGELDGDRFALGQDGETVRLQQAALLGEFAIPAAPAVHHAEALERGRVLRHGDRVEDADDNEFAVAFLADVIADKTGLQIG